MKNRTRPIQIAALAVTALAVVSFAAAGATAAWTAAARTCSFQLASATCCRSRATSPPLGEPRPRRGAGCRV